MDRDTLKLIEITGSKDIAEEVMQSAMDLEENQDNVCADDILSKVIASAEVIMESRGKTTLGKREMMGLLKRSMADDLSAIIRGKEKNRVRHIRVGDMYVVYRGPGDYMLTPDKGASSRFPTEKAAEKYMRKLWIDNGDVSV